MFHQLVANFVYLPLGAEQVMYSGFIKALLLPAAAAAPAGTEVPESGEGLNQTSQVAHDKSITMCWKRQKHIDEGNYSGG